MRSGEEFYKIEGLISKKDIDNLLKKRNRESNHKASIVFEAIENNGIKVYELSISAASARIQREHITLDVSGNGESTIKKGFERHKIEYDELEDKA